MNINGIETQYPNYAGTGIYSAKSSSSESTFASFQKELVNWEKRTKEAIDKEQENDSKGNIQMSEKQWRKLMKKVDNAINTVKDNEKEQEKAGKLIRKDTAAGNLETHKSDVRFLEPQLVQTSNDTTFLPVHKKKD